MSKSPVDDDSMFPIDQLPFDILRQVLVTCYMDLVSSNSPNPVHISVVLSHVSRYWRQIVISVPQMWSSIYIRRDVGDSPDALYQRTEACLDRSKSHPLFISIQIPFSLRSQELSPLKNVVDQLIPHSHRWHSMSVNAPLDTHQILSRAKDHMKSLHILHCNIWTHFALFNLGPSWDTSVRFAYKDAPSLKILYSNYSNGLGHSAIETPWERLETWIGSPRESELTEIYLRGHNLSTLLLRHFPFSGSPTSFRAPTSTVLPNLTSLSLIIRSTDVDLLRNNALPTSLKLQRFSLKLELGTNGSFLDWLSNLPVTLSMFSFAGHSQLRSIDVARILNAIPQSNLTHLRIICPGLQNDIDILTRLVRTPAASARYLPSATSIDDVIAPFPRLEYLDVVQYRDVLPAWLPFLEARCLKLPTPLRAAYLSYSRLQTTPDKEVMGDVLEALQRNGVTFKIEPWGIGDYTPTLKELMRKVRWDEELEQTVRMSPWSGLLPS